MKGVVAFLGLLLAAIAVYLLWRRGTFAGLGFMPPPPAGYNPQPFPGGLGPKEYGTAAPGGGASTFNRACNEVYSRVGQVAMQAPDPRAQVAGMAATTLGPLACAGYEWAGKKAVEGTKYVAKGTAAGVKTGAKAVASTASKAWNAIF